MLRGRNQTKRDTLVLLEIQRRSSRTDLQWGRMANNCEEGQGSQRAVVSVMMMMMIHCVINAPTVKYS
jgi:hypothetical protein